MVESDYDAFFSYSHRDSDVVLSVANELRAYGLSFFLDVWSLRLGDVIPREIEHALSRSKCGIVFFSEAALHSSWCRAEYDRMLSQTMRDACFRLIPIRLDKIELPGFAHDRLYYDLSTFSQVALSDLMRGILDALGYDSKEKANVGSAVTRPEALSARILYMIDALELSDNQSAPLKEIAALLMRPEIAVTPVDQCRCGGDILHGYADLGSVDYHDVNFYVCTDCFLHCHCEEYTGIGQDYEGFGQGRCGGCVVLLKKSYSRRTGSLNKER